MKKWLKRAAIGVFLALVLGSGLVLSGVVPIAASSGHWQITSWFLNFAKQRSVATHSLTIDPPADLRDSDLVLRGAGHYASGCAFCHGAPGQRMPPVPAAMTPHPPPLDHAASEFAADELFYIVKHGIKFTGMPAWPAQQRDDEVWAVTAFLLALPQLSEAEYLRLTAVDGSFPENAPDVVHRVCARCHGADGLGRQGAFPRLAGQKSEYLRASLEAYRNGDRPSGIMEPIAASLSAEAIQAASAYYSGLRPALASGEGTAALGKKIATEGIPEQKLPGCIDCHGAQKSTEAVYPHLAGQAAWYLRSQLKLFRSGHRGGTSYARIMREVAAHELSDRQIDAVAAHFAGLADAPL